MAVDTRKLKDSVAELLKKGKFEKAAGQLEELVRAEPRETQHRLKLGDAYRKSGERERSIAAYQAAAKAYSDEGQLIKAIAAVKVILEIDPSNAMAQRELDDMNTRRFAKPGQGVQKQGAPRALGARAVSEIELAEGETATNSIAEQLSAELGTTPRNGSGGGAFENDSEPLELDEPEPAGRKPPPPKRAPEAPPQRYRPAETEAIDLPEPDLVAMKPAEPQPPPGRRGQPLPEPLQPLDEPDLIELAPDVAAQKPPPQSDLDLELVEPEPIEAEALLVEVTPEKPAPPLPPEAIELEVAAEGAPPQKKPITGPQPIGDLITAAAGTDEEVELLSISTDQETTAPPPASVAVPKVTATPEDLDAAFGAIVDEHEKAAPRKLPAKVPLFSDLPQDAFVELVKALDYRNYQPGEVILREGEPGRSFFVIVQGRVRVFKRLGAQEMTLAMLEEGAFFGEMAMLSGAPRTATIAAEVETEVLEVTDKVLRQLAQKYPNVASVLKNFYRQRLLNNVMAISPLFKDFDASERKALMGKFRMRQAVPGEKLIEQGKKSDGLYVVLHGAVEVKAQGPNGSVDLATLKEGDIFGEMSLLTHGPASATVTAAVPSIVLKLARDQFQEMILTHPQILELVSTLTDQRRSATEAILRGLGPGQDGMAFV